MLQLAEIDSPTYTDAVRCLLGKSPHYTLSVRHGIFDTPDEIFEGLHGKLSGQSLFGTYIKLANQRLAEQSLTEGERNTLNARINIAELLEFNEIRYHTPLESPTDAEPHVVSRPGQPLEIQVGGGAGNGGYSIHLRKGENTVDHGSN